MFLPANITLQFGDAGDFVAELQRRLASVNAHPDHGINGAFDGMTVNSVSSFQSRVGIRADGIAGPETLRRLNGVISGDAGWGSTDTKAEEEARKAAEETERLRQAEMMRVEEARQQQAEMERRAAESAYHAQHQPAAAESAHHAQHQPAAAESMYRSNEFADPQHTAQPAVQQAPAMPLNMGEMLAQMMQQNTPASHAATPQGEQPGLSPAEAFARQMEQQKIPMQAATVTHAQPIQHIQPAQSLQHEQATQPLQHAQPVVQSPAELLVQQLQQHTQKQPGTPPSAADALIQQLQQQTKAQQQAAPQPQPARAIAEAPPNVPLVAMEERPRSLVGRALQKMDEMFQKLAQHFETRLPPDVLREVERIGQRMAKSGVVEAGMADAPETARGTAPARGPEQPQTALRG